MYVFYFAIVFHLILLSQRSDTWALKCACGEQKRTFLCPQRYVQEAH